MKGVIFMYKKKFVKLIALLAVGAVLTSPVSAYTGGGVSGALAGNQGAAELSDDDSYEDRLTDFDEEDYSSDGDQDDSYDASYDDSYDDDSYDHSYSDDTDGDDSHDDSYSDDSDGDDSHDNSYSDDSDGDDSHDNSYSDDTDGDDSHDNSYSDDSDDDDSHDDSYSDDSDDDSDHDGSDDDSPADSSERTYLGNFKLTAYCHCAACNGSAGQPTASGRMPSAGRTVAMGGVDFGTRLSINGHIYTVEDTGTPYGHVDIFMDSHSEAEDFGVQYADVYLVE